MKYLPHLKIEFRAVDYSSDAHVLEYRISPDQDLTYEDEISIFGLFKIKLKKKFSTRWHMPYEFLNWPGSERYSKESGEPYVPMFVHDRKELEDYKKKFKTIGEFLDYKHKEDAKEEAKWQIERTEYLNKQGIWK